MQELRLPNPLIPNPQSPVTHLQLLMLQVSMGDANCLPTGDTHLSAHTITINLKSNNLVYQNVLYHIL